jgi:hypothetical protein
MESFIDNKECSAKRTSSPNTRRGANFYAKEYFNLDGSRAKVGYFAPQVYPQSYFKINKLNNIDPYFQKQKPVQNYMNNNDAYNKLVQSSLTNFENYYNKKSSEEDIAAIIPPETRPPRSNIDAFYERLTQRSTHKTKLKQVHYDKLNRFRANLDFLSKNSKSRFKYGEKDEEAFSSKYFDEYGDYHSTSLTGFNNTSRKHEKMSVKSALKPNTPASNYDNHHMQSNSNYNNHFHHNQEADLVEYYTLIKDRRLKLIDEKSSRYTHLGKRF